MYTSGVPDMVQWAKDTALLCRLQLQLGFDPWPWNFHMPWVQGEKEKQINKQTKKTQKTKNQKSVYLLTQHIIVN